MISSLDWNPACVVSVVCVFCAIRWDVCTCWDEDSAEVGLRALGDDTVHDVRHGRPGSDPDDLGGSVRYRDDVYENMARVTSDK